MYKEIFENLHSRVVRAIRINPKASTNSIPEFLSLQKLSSLFKGSFGIYCPEVRYISGGGIGMGPPTYILLGLLFAGPFYTSEGRIEIKEIPTATETLATFNTQMIHLGYYVKAKEILVLWDSIKLKINNPAASNEK